MALQLQLHPNVAPLFGQAQVTARGPNPQLMCDPGHTLHGYNANWFNTQNNFGPGGEVGIDEGDIAAFLANAVRPGDNAKVGKLQCNREMALEITVKLQCNYITAEITQAATSGSICFP